MLNVMALEKTAQKNKKCCFKKIDRLHLIC
jgi:hypothetical protein